MVTSGEGSVLHVLHTYSLRIREVSVHTATSSLCFKNVHIPTILCFCPPPVTAIWSLVQHLCVLTDASESKGTRLLRVLQSSGLEEGCCVHWVNSPHTKDPGFPNNTSAAMLPAGVPKSTVQITCRKTISNVDIYIQRPSCSTGREWRCSHLICLPKNCSDKNCDLGLDKDFLEMTS